MTASYVSYLLNKLHFLSCSICYKFIHSNTKLIEFPFKILFTLISSFISFVSYLFDLIDVYFPFDKPRKLQFFFIYIKSNEKLMLFLNILMTALTASCFFFQIYSIDFLFFIFILFNMLHIYLLN